MSAVLLHVRPIIIAVSIVALIALIFAIRLFNARDRIPRGYEPYYDAWRCKRCGAFVQDEWDLEPHRLSHLVHSEVADRGLKVTHRRAVRGTKAPVLETVRARGAVGDGGSDSR